MRETEGLVGVRRNCIKIAKDCWKKGLYALRQPKLLTDLRGDMDTHTTRHVVHASQVRAAKDSELVPIDEVSSFLHDLVINAVQEGLVVDGLDVHVVKDIVEVVHRDWTAIDDGPDGVEEAGHFLAFLLELIRVVEVLRRLCKRVTVGPTFKCSRLLRLDCVNIRQSALTNGRATRGVLLEAMDTYW